MNEAFRKWFWGYIISFFALNINGFDLLLDPFGYLLIFLGVTRLLDRFPEKKKAKHLAGLLLLLSLPLVVIPESPGLPGEGRIDLWFMYKSFIGLIDLLLVYFIFRLMIQMAGYFQNQELRKRTKRMFTLYITVSFSYLLLSSIMMNINPNWQLEIGLLISIVKLIADISFLILIRRFYKLD